jgi:apolipoprotein N-acyltransferase
MRRITSLSILFAALIEFAIERARFDLWIVAVVAIVALLWNVAGRTLRPDVSSKKHDHNTFTIQGVVCNFR